MRVFAKILALWCIFVGSAFADENTWEGSYFGLSGGLVTGTENHSWSGNPGGVDVDVSGAVLGLTYGRNFQTNNIVYGFEADWNFSNADGFERVIGPFGSSTPCITPGEACSNELNAYVTFRGRLGVALENGLLPFFTFGIAAGDVTATADFGACGGPCQIDETRFGYIVGVGAEKMIRNGWSVKAEYSYLDFGRDVLDGSSAVGNVQAEFNYSIFKVGVNRKF